MKNKCCSNQETLGTCGRHSGDFRRVFGHRWHSYNAKISRRLQIFVPWGLAGMPSCLVKFSRSVEKTIVKTFRVLAAIKYVAELPISPWSNVESFLTSSSPS